MKGNPMSKDAKKPDNWKPIGSLAADLLKKVSGEKK